VPITIRAAGVSDAGAIARVHIDTWRHTYAGTIGAAYLARLDYDRAARSWETHLAREDSRVFVAEDPAAGVVGIASGGPNKPSPGESGEPGEWTAYGADLYNIYILPAYQRQGLGRALVAAVVRALVTDGFRSMVIWVLKGNPACGFYERLGGLPVGERRQRVGGLDLDTVAYGWPELDRLGAVLGTPGQAEGSFSEE
jgi:ribosomal protein S18 acetylase RimI-like enzyme